MSKSQRLQILTKAEITALYHRPQFTTHEQQHYFSLQKAARDDLNIRKTNGKRCSTILYFILQSGYFRAKHQFFTINYRQARTDVLFIMKQYLPNDPIPNQLPTRKMQAQAKKKILHWLGYGQNSNEAISVIFKKASLLVRKTQNLLEIFNETIQALEDRKLVLPSYTKIQDTIGSALKNEDKRLIQLVKRCLNQQTKLALDDLFKNDEAFYHVTELKFDAKSFQTTQMAAELKKLNLCKPIYNFSLHFLPKLLLSQRMIDDYASLAKVYTIARLQKLPKELAYLYLICYVQGRYECLMNNLIQGFVYYIDKYSEAGQQYAKDELATSMNPLETHQLGIGQLMQLYTNQQIMSLTGHEIQQQAFNIMAEADIMKVSESLLNQENRITKERRLLWEYHKKNYHAISMNLRPLFLAIDFEYANHLTDLSIASQYLKKLFREEKKLKNMPINAVPTAHIKPKALLNCFFETAKAPAKSKPAKKTIPSMKTEINPYQYEFYLYRAIRENLRKNNVYVNHSTGYKSFEAEVKIDPNWDKNQNKILKNLNNKVLLTPIDNILDALENILEPLIIRVNQRISNGENKHVKIVRHRNGEVHWTIAYPKQNTEIDNPFYDQLEIKTISEIFDFVAKNCYFMKAFRHIKPRYAKSKLDYLGVKGTILANGTLQGKHSFSKCSNLKYQRLQTAEQNHVRIETLRDAADILVNDIINLPIFDLYDLSGHKHGSADGTKKKTRRRLLKARHSPKYFGLDIGLVIMTMNVGHVPFVTNIIGANEHESHFIYPMLQQNHSLLDPDIISTDTAGANNINDFLYYLLGKIHAPCYRSLPDKAKTICGFKPLSFYKDLLIKPSKSVNKKRIKKQWPKLLPVLVSLLSHDVNQEKIIAILSSHEYKSDMKDAFWELNQITKSIHILKYIDDPQYRRDIRTALNRGEAYHQLINKITAVGGGQFRGMSELEVEIWNECTRLIALVIIYYNMNLLSKLYEIALKNGDEAVIQFLKHLSPIASQHINISGLYELSETMADINVTHIVEMLNKILKDTINAPLEKEKRKNKQRTK